MTKVLVLAADAYRMIDALKDYADALETEAKGYDSMAPFARNAAKNIENGIRSMGMIEVESFDLDAAHSAVIGVMTRRYARAQELRDEAGQLERSGKLLEGLLSAF